MWSNVIPPFVPLNLNLYPAYQIGTKGFDYLIFRNYTCFVPGIVYRIPEQPIVPPTYIPFLVGNQFPTVVQPLTNRDKQPIQQLVTVLVPTTIQVTTSLPTHIPRGCDHQPLDGEQPRDSPRGSSPRRNLLGKPPFNPPIGPFGWPTPNSRMFIPPWYQPLVVQLVSKLTTELPYRKLQYPTFVKDTSPNFHIKVFKKAIKVNGETIKSNIINLFGFTLRDSICEWGENNVQDHPNYIFEKLGQAFCK
jgi:hypothetical protein